MNASHGAEQKRDELLRKAEEAERKTKKARDPQIRESWMTIAMAYRELAEGVG